VLLQVARVLLQPACVLLQVARVLLQPACVELPAITIYSTALTLYNILTYNKCNI
jgi:hypothetical protein